MAEYRVRYEIDVDAETPVEAAKQAWAIMMDPASTPPMLEVFDENGVSEVVDLETEGE